MASSTKKLDIYNSEEGRLIAEELKKMVLDNHYNTDDSYSANIVTNPDHKISFVDKHLKYLSEHRSVNPTHYLSNLKLMSKIRK